jgi:hypothetical protein
VCSGECSPDEADEATVTIDRAAGRGRAAAARQALTLPLLLVVEVIAVLGLHRLGRIPALRVPWDDFGRHLGPWLAQSPVEQVLGAVLRNIALVAAWWLLASTGLYLLASLARAPALIRGAARVTLPAVRRAADGAVAVALATSLLSATTTAAVAATPTARSGPPAPVRAAVAARAPAALQAGPTTTTRQEPAKPGYTPGAAGLGQPASTTTSISTTRSTPAPSTTTPHQPTPRAAAPGYRPGAAGLGKEGQEGTTTTPTSTTTASTTSTTSTSTTSTSTTSTSTTTTSTTRPPAPSATAGATTTTADTTTTTKPAAPPPSGGAPATPGPRRPAYVPDTAGPPQAPNRQGPAPGQPEPGLHEVERGENLWEISRNHLASATGRDPAEIGTREVAAYWLRVVAANRARLPSRNPNLIHPHEHVRLPAIRRSG